MIKKFKVKVNSRSYDVEVEEVDDASSYAHGSETKQMEDKDPAIIKKHRSVVVYKPGDVCEIKAPLPGSITEICIEEGKVVTAGEPILVLEAMKMENSIVSPTSGTVSKIHVEGGTTVMGNQLLVTINC